MLDSLQIVSFIQIPLMASLHHLKKKVSFVNKVTPTNKLTVVYKGKQKHFFNQTRLIG